MDKWEELRKVIKTFVQLNENYIQDSIKEKGKLPSKRNMDTIQIENNLLYGLLKDMENLDKGKKII